MLTNWVVLDNDDLLKNLFSLNSPQKSVRIAKTNWTHCKNGSYILKQSRLDNGNSQTLGEKKKEQCLESGTCMSVCCRIWFAHTNKRPVFVFIQIRVYSCARYSLFYRWKMFETNGNECTAWIDTLRAFNSIYADIACLNSWAIERSHETSSLIWNSSIFLFSPIFHSFCLSHTCALSLPSSIDFMVGQLQVAFIFFVYDSTIFNFISRHTLDHHFKFVLFHTKQSKTNQPTNHQVYLLVSNRIQSRSKRKLSHCLAYFFLQLYDIVFFKPRV